MSKKPSWLSAQQAAALLDVKLATLYAYKSRGLIESVPSPDGRGRRYARASIERLKARHDARKGHAAVAAGALRFGEPSLETSVSEIRSDGPYYRGHAAIDLCARETSFEAVCDLLLLGQLPARDDWSNELREAPPLVDAASGYGRCVRMLIAERLRRGAERPHNVSAYLATLVSLAGLSASARQASRAHAGEPDVRCARRLIAWLALHVGAHGGRRRPPKLAERVLRSLGATPSPLAVRVVDRTLVLCADHELNASTFAARVTASTGGDLFACLAAALHTHSGSRHGAASARLEAQLREIRRPADAARALRERSARGEYIHGFGHPLYPQGDPRGRMLFELALQLATHSRPRRPASLTFERLYAVHAAMQRAGYPGPNLDAGLVAVASALGLPEGSAAALFAIGRCPGWAAHALEQRQLPFVLRPRALYVPPAPRTD